MYNLVDIWLKLVVFVFVSGSNMVTSMITCGYTRFKCLKWSKMGKDWLQMVEMVLNGSILRQMHG